MRGERFVPVAEAHAGVEANRMRKGRKFGSDAKRVSVRRHATHAALASAGAQARILARTVGFAGLGLAAPHGARGRPQPVRSSNDFVLNAISPSSSRTVTIIQMPRSVRPAAGKEHAIRPATPPLCDHCTAIFEEQEPRCNAYQKAVPAPQQSSKVPARCFFVRDAAQIDRPEVSFAEAHTILVPRPTIPTVRPLGKCGGGPGALWGHCS